MTRVTFYTRRNCHLCDVAKEAVRGSGVPVEITEIDIDTDAKLVKRYGNDVPIIVVDGVEAFRHRVKPEEFAAYVREGGREQLNGAWKVVDEHHLERELQFPDFAQALAFTNAVGAIAEEQQHHPDIYLTWGKVRIAVWTHDVDGLTRKDLDLAAKIDRIPV